MGKCTEDGRFPPTNDFTGTEVRIPSGFMGSPNSNPGERRGKEEVLPHFHTDIRPHDYTEYNLSTIVIDQSAIDLQSAILMLILIM